ncbi:hypothetical protein THAR02_11301 [Trichoderma harzianum]|uniref:Apple domain-containing protein n=1 Tax=Trichoderma harzianum TaxID=5544 RepID=A0A0F9WVU9_TRIHA|nr:hypothetical protein THAR02_11301 [Trichoderma harzianum]
MLPFAHVLLWSLVLVPSLAQTSPSLCGQTNTSKSQALSNCCPAFDKKTDTFPDGEAYSYHCDSSLKLTRYGGKAPLDPGTCAQACSKDENCVGASWDSTSSASCWFISIVKKDGSIALRHALPPLDCSSQISSAVSSASVSIQAAASSSCASKASYAVQSAQAAAETSCSSRITSAVDSASTAISGAVASAQSAAETSCSSRITSAVDSAITSGASMAISGAVASAQTACQSSIASLNSAASSNELSISAAVSQSAISAMVEHNKYNLLEITGWMFLARIFLLT